MLRNTCFSRIEQVERSYRTALQTVRVLIRLAEDQPKYLDATKRTAKPGMLRKGRRPGTSQDRPILSKLSRDLTYQR
jgi:hypothetical protein